MRYSYFAPLEFNGRHQQYHSYNKTHIPYFNHGLFTRRIREYPLPNSLKIVDTILIMRGDP